MTAATLTLDLNTRAGRLAARAYLDALDEADQPAPGHCSTSQPPAPMAEEVQSDAPAEVVVPTVWDQISVGGFDWLSNPADFLEAQVRPEEASDAFECIDVADEGQGEAEPTEQVTATPVAPVEPDPETTALTEAPKAESATTDPLPEGGDAPAPAADPQDVAAPEEAEHRPEIAVALTADEIDADIRAQILSLRAAGDGQVMIAAKLQVAAERVKTVIAEDLAAKLDAPMPAAPAKAKPKAPEPKPAPAPEPPALIHGARVVRRDIDRPWTDEIKAEVWRLHKAGVRRAEIADTLGIRADRISGFVNNIKQGRMKAPDIGPGTAVALTGSTAVSVASRPVAQDPQMVMKRREEMTEAERRKFVARSVYPDMQE